MAPIKRRNNNNLIVCGAPAANNPPTPPDPPNGSAPSPSLLKALEAVVEAGRRGLLGPAAMVAAAAAKPNLNQGNSIGVVCQGAQSRIPLVTGQTKKKKRKNKTQTVNKELGAVIPLVQPLVQPVEAQSYPAPPLMQPVVEGRMGDFGKPPVGLRCVKSPQATRKEIWICGNSVILTSKRRAKIHPCGLRLGVPDSSGYVYWHGIRAMMWDQLVPLLHEMYQIRSSPSVIIIHLGENDLLPDNSTSLIIKIKNDLGILSRAFVGTTLVWSSLLPRRFWKEDQAPEVMEKALKFINSKMAQYCSEIGTYFLSHDLITSDQPSLFLPDSNDLSDEGADIFVADLAKVLDFIHYVKG